MPELGDGFAKSIEHKHFLKAISLFLLIILAVWGSYHFFIETQIAEEAAGVRFQAK